MVRLNGIDAPEKHSKNDIEVEAGIHVMYYLTQLLTNKTLYLQTIKYEDKYGRYLAEVYINEASMLHSINQLLIDNKLVHKYDGGTKLLWTDEELINIMKI